MSLFLRLLLIGLVTVCNGQVDEDQSEPLPGDLHTLGVISPTANAIALILSQDSTGQNATKGPIPATKEEAAFPQCFEWYGISAQLTALFNATDGSGCTDLARAAIRISFHDAGTWSQNLSTQGQNFGGADGSIFLFQEWQRSENAGMQENIEILGQLAQSNNVSVADMIQFAGSHAIVTCPLGPRIRTFVGRKDATQPSPMNLLPSAFADGDSLVNLFQDKTISAHGLTALVGAHSTSRQFLTNTSCIGCSQDFTPAVWDVRFYNDTLNPLSAEDSEFVYKFPSDVNISNQGQARSEWLLFSFNNTEAGDPQNHWDEDFSEAYIRLGLLSVMNINADITECTDALPGGIGDGQAEPPVNQDFNFHGGLQPPTPLPGATLPSNSTSTSKMRRANRGRSA